MALVMPLAGKLADRHGGGLLALIGVTVTTIFTVPAGVGRRAHVDRVAVVDDVPARDRHGVRASCRP